MNGIFLLGGHRGLGCTDSSHAAQHRAVANLPAENTMASYNAAFAAGADFIEVDIVPCASGELLLCHSLRLAEHVLTQTSAQAPPHAYLNQLTLAQAQQLPVGPNGTGTIPSLQQLLTALPALAVHSRSNFWLNIEIKGAKGTTQPHHSAALIARLVQEIDGFPLERLLFSSFALSELVLLHKLLPKAALALLTVDEGGIGKNFYADSAETYLPFTASTVQQALQAVPLTAIHPELQTLNAEALNATHKAGLMLNCWCWQEQPYNTHSHKLKQALALCAAHHQKLNLITDYLDQAQAFRTPT